MPLSGPFYGTKKALKKQTNRVPPKVEEKSFKLAERLLESHYDARASKFEAFAKRVSSAILNMEA